MATAFVDTLKKALKKKKSNSRVFSWIADLDRAAGDLESALQWVTTGLVEYPKDVLGMLVRSKILFEQKEFEACIEECEKVLKVDPFCLSAQKRMGDAYQELGNENERNKCYRRVHDMDPLDPFWKEEYDVVEEDVAVQEPTLPEADLNLDLSNDFSDFTLEKSPEEGSFLEKSDEPFFEKEPDSEEDPFASLASLMPNTDNEEEAVLDDLQASLDSVAAEIEMEIPAEREVFPTDEEFNNRDVNDAFSDMFGIEDDLEPEQEQEVSPFSNIPHSLEEETPVVQSPADDFADEEPQSVSGAFNAIFGDDELPEEPAPEAIAEAPVEEKPQSVDDAFASIFGEDELPEEGGSLFEKSSDENFSLSEPSAPEIEEEPAPEAIAEAPIEEKPQSVDDAFASIFGEDELPEEGGSLFEKSSDENFSLSEPSALEIEEEPAPEAIAEAPVEEKPQSVDDAFASIFGDDELPEEPSFEKSADATLEMPVLESSEEKVASDFSLDSSIAQEEPRITIDETATEKTEDEFKIDSAFDALFGESDDLEQEQEVPVLDEPSSSVETPSEKKDEFSIDSAFDSLFGKEDDDTLTAAEIEEKSIPETLFEDEPKKVESDNLEEAVSSAFAGLFNADDDLPEEQPNNKGVDFLMSGDSDDEVVGSLLKDPNAPLDRGAAEIDESLNTRTLAEIYFEQGLYSKALDIYSDLAEKNPSDEEIVNRLLEIEQVYREKIGDK